MTLKTILQSGTPKQGLPKVEAQTLVPWGSGLHSHTVLGVSGGCSVPVREETDLWVNFLEQAVQLTVAVHGGSKTPAHVKQRLQMLKSLM